MADNKIDNPTFKDVKENPNYYLNELVNHPNWYLLFQFAPYIVHWTNYESAKKSVNYDEGNIYNSILRFIMDNHTLITIFRANSQYKDIQDKIIEFMNTIPGRNRALDDDPKMKLYNTLISRIHNNAANFLESWHNQFVTNKWLINQEIPTEAREDFISSSCPIVPYMGTITKPMGQEIDDEEDAVAPIGTNSTVFILSNPYAPLLDSVDTDNTKGASIPFGDPLVASLINAMPYLFDYAELAIDVNPDLITDDQAILNDFVFPYKVGELISYEITTPKCSELHAAIQYYLLSYCIFQFTPNNFNLVSKLINSKYNKLRQPLVMLIDYDNNTTDNKSDSTESGALDSYKVIEAALNGLSDFDLPNEDESPFTKEFNKNMEFEARKKMEEIKDLGHDEKDSSLYEKMPNIDKLLGYIDAYQRYTSDDYTNSLFIDTNPQPVQSWYWYYHGKLIASPKASIICTPVIDIAEDYSPKILLIDENDKDSKVQIIDGLKLGKNINDIDTENQNEELIREMNNL